MKKIILFILFFSFFRVSAQNNFVTTYVRSINPSAYNEGSSCIDLVGTTGYIIGGGLFTTNTPGPILFRTDIQGNVVWDTLASPFSAAEWFTCVKGTSDGGFLAIDDIGYLYKFSSTNNLQWSVNTNCHSSFASFHPKLIEISNGYIITGENGLNASLVKLDHNGNPVFTKLFSSGINNGNFLMGIKQTHDRGYISTGTSSDNSGNPSVYLVKTDSSGNFQWSKTFTGAGNSDIATDVLIAPDGGYFILDGVNAGNNTILIKTDSLGNLKWAKNYAVDIYSYSHNMTNTIDNKIVIAGSGPKHFLMKLDTNGNWKWTHKYFNDNYDNPTMVRTTSDGGFVTVQSTSDYSPNRHCLIKTDSLGNIGGLCTDSSAAAPAIIDVTSSFTVNAYPNNAAGVLTVSNIPDDLGIDTITKYVQCNGMVLSTETSQEKIKISLTIYPNPSSGIFTLSSSEKINSIEIFDVLGKEIKKFEVRGMKFEINISDQAKGIYFVKILDENGNFGVKKIILE